MDISVAGLKNLIFKIHRFVNGSSTDVVELEDGRKIKTLAGIQQTVQDRSYIQVVKDYDSYALATSDALNGTIIKEGDVIKVHNDTDKRLNRFYEVTSAANLRAIDGYELFNFFPETAKIKRSSSSPIHSAFEWTIGKPLMGQSTHGAFGFHAFLRTSKNARSLLTGTVVYGVQEDGTPYSEIVKMSTSSELDVVCQIEDMGDYFSFEFIAKPVDIATEFTISTVIDNIYNPETY